LETVERPPEKWLKPREVSALFVEAGLYPIPPSTFRDWSEAGHLPVTRTAGGHRRVREIDALALIAELKAAA